MKQQRHTRRKKEKSWNTKYKSAQPNIRNNKKKKTKKQLKDKTIRDARVLFELEKENYQSAETKLAFGKNFLAYEFNVDYR